MNECKVMEATGTTTTIINTTCEPVVFYRLHALPKKQYEHKVLKIT